MVKSEQGTFRFTGSTLIRTDAGPSPAVDYFIKQLQQRNFNNQVVAGGNAGGSPEIFITSAGAAQLPAEGYSLRIEQQGITLIGKDAGLFYGLQTLLQLMDASTGDTAALPCLRIEDAPRFGYRGLMLDVSRHFFTVQQVKDLLDLMAYYKLNRFHWHLTDDQGWRVEIKRYPQLTDVGAWRVPRLDFSGNTLPPQPGEAATDGGFYTQENIKDIVRYAAARHIEILPEIDVPGHSMAAIASCPWLCVTGDTSIKVNPGSSFAKWFTTGGFEMYVDNSLNPVQESTYTFLDGVFTEIAALFPYPYIHIGGDECYKGFWEKDKRVQQFMRQHRLKDAHALQAWFITRLNKIITSKGKKMIAWDEAATGGMKEPITIMNRFGEKEAVTQLKKGMQIILAPGGNGLYFDYAQSASDQEPASHGGDAPAWKAYAFDPLYPALSAREHAAILGVEGCVWTEHIPDVSKLQYMLLPRMLALAETGWTDLAAKNYSRFADTALPMHLARFDRQGMNYRVPTGFSYTDTTITTASYHFKIAQPPVPGAKVYFTLNNRPPGDYDHLYQAPLTIQVPKGKTITLKTVVITPAGHRSIITKTVLTNPEK